MDDDDRAARHEEKRKALEKIHAVKEDMGWYSFTCKPSAGISSPAVQRGLPLFARSSATVGGKSTSLSELPFVFPVVNILSSCATVSMPKDQYLYASITSWLTVLLNNPVKSAAAQHLTCLFSKLGISLVTHLPDPLLLETPVERTPPLDPLLSAHLTWTSLSHLPLNSAEQCKENILL